VSKIDKADEIYFIESGLVPTPHVVPIYKSHAAEDRMKAYRSSDHVRMGLEVFMDGVDSGMLCIEIIR